MLPETFVAVTPRAQLMVPESAVVLKRFYFLERTLVMLQAGWLPAVEHWETKLILPEFLWQNAIFVRELRQRILELRFPERRIVADEDGPLVGLARRWGDAPNALAFVEGLARVVRPFTRRLYQRYRASADALDDAPTLYILAHALADLDAQIARWQSIATAYMEAFPEHAPAADQWSREVRDSLENLEDAFFAPEKMAGTFPIDILPSGKVFAVSRTAARDRRFHRVPFAWPDRHTPAPAGEGRRLQVRQAVHHVNEVWAAEMAAACLFDLADRAPSEFLDDAARWCYDEIRHCRMGYERLKAWGYADADIPLDTFSYDAGSGLDALERLGIIFFFESTYIHTKPERMRLFRALGDRMSSHDMDFDWADELIHTHYGKRWLEHLLQKEGAHRSIAQVKEAAHAAIVARQQHASAEDKALAEHIVDRLLAAE